MGSLRWNKSENNSTLHPAKKSPQRLLAAAVDVNDSDPKKGRGLFDALVVFAGAGVHTDFISRVDEQGNFHRCTGIYGRWFE